MFPVGTTRMLYVRGRGATGNQLCRRGSRPGRRAATVAVQSAPVKAVGAAGDVLRSMAGSAVRDLKPSDAIVVLTGAGISRESGLDTFRDAGGICARVRIEDVATPEAFARAPAREIGRAPV